MNTAGQMAYLTVETVKNSEPIMAFLTQRFSRALLILGDLTEFLSPYIHKVLVAGEVHFPRGVAILFTGFSPPIISIVADDLRVSQLMVQELLKNAAAPTLLIVNNDEPLFEIVGALPGDTDIWMIRPTEKYEENPLTQRIQRSEPLVPLYSACELNFWLPEMVQFGHYYGVYKNGNVCSASGVNFVIEHAAYAQIGNVATLPQDRNQGYASQSVFSTINSLARFGLKKCGLFVDSEDARLLRWYSRLGFKPICRFHFRMIDWDSDIFLQG